MSTHLVKKKFSSSKTHAPELLALIVVERELVGDRFFSVEIELDLFQLSAVGVDDWELARFVGALLLPVEVAVRDTEVLLLRLLNHNNICSRNLSRKSAGCS